MSDKEKNGFDYARYYRRIKDLERLSAGAEEITAWTEKYERPQRSVDVLLYLGCNILITSHLAIEVVNVFKRLGIDFEAIGGPQFCCGVPHYYHGDVDPARRLSNATVEKMESYGASTLVMWCPSCDVQFEDVILPALEHAFPSRITHATQFLADRATELPFESPVNSRVAVHTHVGHRRQDRDARAALRLLDAVPGVEIVGTVSSDVLGYHCPTPPDAEARRVFEHERAALLEQARSLGADTVVTLYHSCHREWCEMSTDELQIRNYISLVAESLGCRAEDRFTRLRQLTTEDEIVEASTQQWTSHGWDAERAHAAAASLPPNEVMKNDTPNS